MSTATKKYMSTMERSVEGTLPRTICSARPTPSPAARVRGRDRIRAMRATTSTRSSSGGASDSVPALAALMFCKMA